MARTQSLRIWASLLVANTLSVGICQGEGQDPAQLEAEARSQATEADVRFKAADYATALPLYQAEFASRKALGDLKYAAYAARAIGCCQEQLGDLDAAISSWKTAATFDTKREDRGFEGYDWFLIGKAELSRDHHPDAIKALEQALPLLGQAVDRDHECDARLLLAIAWLDQGQPGKSKPHLERGLTLARALKDLKRQANLLAQFGRVKLAEDEAGPATEWLSEARALYQELSLEPEIAAMDRALGDALLDLDHAEAAQAFAERACLFYETHENFAEAAEIHQFLAALRAAEDDPQGALAFSRKAVAAAQSENDPKLEVETLVSLAHHQSLVNDWPGARSTLDQALRLAEDGTPAEQVRLQVLAADVAHRVRDYASATAHLSQGETIARRENNAALLEIIKAAKQRNR